MYTAGYYNLLVHASLCGGLVVAAAVLEHGAMIKSFLIGFRVVERVNPGLFAV